MDFRQLARYFDRQDLENYDFVNQRWVNRFKGQLKVSDKFQTIFHRPTRKRMLYCTPNSAPTSTVVRVVGSNTVYFVGALQDDHYENNNYRSVYALHKALGSCVITRKAPAGPVEDPGWLVASEIEPATFSDYEFRSLNENQESQEIHRGHYFLVFPTGTDITKQDVVTVGGLDFFILDTYIDSQLILARAAQQSDPRKDLVYKSFVSESYSSASVAKTYTDYNVTGRIVESKSSDSYSNVDLHNFKIYIKSDHIGVVPKLDDSVVIDGLTHDVTSISRDFLEDHWDLGVRF